jgi:hypothetical protein
MYEKSDVSYIFRGIFMGNCAEKYRGTKMHFRGIFMGNYAENLRGL